VGVALPPVDDNEAMMDPERIEMADTTEVDANPSMLILPAGDTTDVKLFPPLEDHDAKYYLGLLVLHLPHFIKKEASFWKIWRKTKVWNQEDEDEDEDDSWGCTSIQGERTEIFLKTKRHPTGSPAAMALIQYIKTKAGSDELGVTNEAFWEYLYCYARRSAIRDTRIPSGYEFGPFSLICTVSTVTGQVPHVDVLGPNFQFTLMVTDQQSTA
jgi:hypothetical protein